MPSFDVVKNIDKDYWIAGRVQMETGKLAYIASNGTVQFSSDAVKGVRLTAYLKPTVRISDSNTGDGSAASPYQLSVN